MSTYAEFAAKAAEKELQELVQVVAAIAKDITRNPETRLQAVHTVLAIAQIEDRYQGP